MRARIYTRVSRLADGRSTKSQEVECRSWCAANDHEVVKVYTDDGKGASRYGKKKRTAWEALKGDLQAGELLVTWEASRSTRDMAEFVALRDLCLVRGVQLAYSGRVIDLSEPDDNFVSGLDFLLAEREAEKIRQRVMRGQKTSRTEGRPHTRPPWGYRIKEVDGVKVRGVWEPDPVEAPRLRRAVKKSLAGETQGAVHRWLESTGYAPSSPTYLTTLLANPVYAGFRTHKGEITGKGTWPALISREQHDLLVARRKWMKEKWGWAAPPGREPKYLLSGIAICGKCELPVRYTRLGGVNGFYQCGRFGHCARRVEDTDRAVEGRLFEVIAKLDPADYETDDPDVAAARAQMNQLKAELEQWRELAERREVEPLFYARQEKNLLAQMAELEPRTRSRVPLTVNLDDVERNWSRYSIRSKREVIRAMFAITIIPGSRSRRDGRLLIEEI